jgi:hypothetical protein
MTVGTMTRSLKWRWVNRSSDNQAGMMVGGGDGIMFHSPNVRSNMRTLCIILPTRIAIKISIIDKKNVEICVYGLTYNEFFNQFLNN